MIFTEIVAFGKNSYRKLAERVGRSKSSVHRHEQARKQRDRHPESSLWETEAGAAWLRVLFFATLYTFGLESHVGADKLGRFFKRLRLDTHLGVSATVLRQQMNQMETLLPLFQQQCEAEAASTWRPAVVAADETFQGDQLILVLLELRSNYLILEDLAEDRQYETWFEKAAPRLHALGLKVRHAASDRAKALVKLATTGFDCAPGADLFHAQYDVCRWLGAKLGRQQAQAEKQRKAAETALQESPAKENVPCLVALVEAERTHEAVKATCADYHAQLAGIAEDVHPFTLESQPKTAASVVSDLENRAQAFERIAKSANIADSRQTLQKFRNQFDALAIHITFWWPWVAETLTGQAVDPALQDWLTHSLLPVVYGYQQSQRTQNKRPREQYRQAWKRASHALQAHEFTWSLPESELQRWLEWAEWIAGKFYRSSSAVEGRNGYLSQRYHNGRGLTEPRLRALTVIHNYGVRRLDGTTAAMRWFDRDFPDLFSWLVDQMGELPLPRQGKKRAVHNPLVLLGVPA